MDYNDSFVIEILKPGSLSENAEKPVLSFNNINVYFNSTALKPSLFSIENEKFMIFSDGSFYLHDSQSMSIGKNLELYLSRLDNHGIEETWEDIAGGLFNLFIIDKKKKILTIVSDFLGAYPVYYTNNNSTILISGNQFNLSRDKTIHEVSLIEFLKYGYLPFSDSFFNDIERKHPWEILTIDFVNYEIAKSNATGLKYVDQDKRLSNINELSEKFKELFVKYFSKFNNEMLLIGLSGGYDSRLITAFLKNNNIQILNFKDFGSTETDIARNVVELLNLNLRFNIQIIPADLIYKFGYDIKKYFRVVQSLEMVHVINLQKKPQEFNCKYYVDGFIGDTVIGASYFFEFKKSIFYIFKYLFGLLKVNGRLKEISYYISRFYNLKNCLDDSVLGSLVTPQFTGYIRDKLGELFKKNYFDAKTDEDMVESLNYTIRGRNLIAGGPAGVNMEAQCYCPFVDKDIFELSLKTEKKLIIGNRLYNIIWRICFPELSHIRKAGQSGSPQDTDFIFRLKQVTSSVYKNIIIPFLNNVFKLGKIQEEVYFSVDNYVKDDNNQLFFNELEKYSFILPDSISTYIMNKKKQKTLNNTLYLRYISLISYMKK